jgi:hypothetical protein
MEIRPSIKFVLIAASIHYLLANVLLYIDYQMLINQSIGTMFVIINYSLIVLLFPVRDILNIFIQHSTYWIFEETILPIIIVSSIFWGTTIYICTQYIKKLRDNHAGS